MKEEFVALETAKILKEKGFVWECERTIDCDKIIRKYDRPQNMSCCTERNGEFVEFLCPTLYVAQKWLREVKGIYVWTEPVIGRKWKISFCDFNVPVEESDWIENEVNKGNGYPVYDTYEEALEAGIQEALKLI